MGRLHVRIQPGARTSAFVGWYGDLPKFAIAAPPVDGAANEAAVAAIARELGLRPHQVRLVGGARSRTKRFEVDGMTDDEIVERLTEICARPPG